MAQPIQSSKPVRARARHEAVSDLPRAKGTRATGPSKAAAWLVAIAVSYVALSASGYALKDPDSTLYEQLSVQIANAPVSGWLVPLWPEHRVKTGRFQEHLAGAFWCAALLQKFGFSRGALLFNLLSVAALCVALERLASRLGAFAGAAPLLYLLSPFGIQYAVRANQEVPWAALSVFALSCLFRDRRSDAVLFAVACAGAFLVKGMVALLLFPAAFALLLARGHLRPRLLRLSLGVVAVVLCAALYELAYRAAAGESFFGAYVGAQLSYVQHAEGLGVVAKLLNVPYYVGLSLWYAAPSTILLGFALFRRRAAAAAPVLAAAASWIALLSLMTRSAIRYAFPVVAALHAPASDLVPEKLKRWRHLPFAAPVLLALVVVARGLLDPIVYRNINPGR